jgi:hypothetical protein
MPKKLLPVHSGQVLEKQFQRPHWEDSEHYARSLDKYYSVRAIDYVGL